jgi:hypothetical protein
MGLPNGMTSSFNVARPISIGRRAIPWLVGPAILVIRGRAVELTGPSACPGLLELMSIAMVRLDPDLRVGQLFDVLHIVVVTAALTAFVELIRRQTRSIAIAAAIGLSVGVSPLFGATLSPPWEAAAFGVCAAAALLTVSRFGRRHGSSRAFVLVSLAILLTGALLVPPWLLVAATGAFVTSAIAWPRVTQSGRWLVAAAAASGLVLLVLVILNLSRPDVLAGSSSWRAVTSCAMPRLSAARTMAYVKSIGWWFGPFALALAVLGAFVEAPRAGWRRSVLTAVIGLVCLVLGSGPPMTTQVALAPTAVLIWWLAASGLEQVVAAIGGGPVRQVAAALVLLLLPTLEASRRVTEQRDDWIRPRGHETQTLRQMTAMLNLVSQDAALVEEDSTVDILLRASVFGGRRRSKPFTVVAPQPDTIAHALVGRAVYAFPHGQEDLSLRGFVIEPLTAARPGRDGGPYEMEGLAAITATRPCQIVGDTWADVAVSSGRFAISADSEAAHGPVVMYFGGAAAGEPRPDGWPRRTIRGFHVLSFARLAPADAARLMADAGTTGLPGGHPLLAEPFILRLTLHRTPRAPLALAVTLGASYPIGVAKLERASTESGHLTVCDAPAVPISALTHRG